MPARRLTRTIDRGPAAPVRMVHLGAGAFFRAHQAWYTDRAEDAQDWGIAAFTGRRPDVARQLAGQDSLYTLSVQGPGGPEDTVVASVVAAHAAEDHAAWLRYLGDPRVAVLTCTVTEHGYLSGPGGTAWDDCDLVADLDLLRRDGPRARAWTVPGRLVAGLAERRRRLGVEGRITVVPCDNLPDNGAVLKRLVLDVAAETVPELVPWLSRHVSFVSTVVDRITPHTTEEDQMNLLRRSGVDDPALVVTEPYTEWILAGTFASDRPRWETIGAQFVPDLEPYALRKLHLLNGAHSLMAYTGLLRGLVTMSEAMADVTVAAWVRDWWGDVVAALGLDAADSALYCDSLVERFANPAIRHPLAQTGTDGSHKLSVRVAPIVRAQLERGAPTAAAIRPLAAWVCVARSPSAGQVRDVDPDLLSSLASADRRTAVRRALAGVHLPTDDTLVELVDAEVGALESARRRGP